MKAEAVQKVVGPWMGVASSTDYPKLAYVADEVKTTVARVFPELGATRVFVGCPHTLKKHSHHQRKDTDRSGRNWRAFMHTNHFPKTICVHPHAETELETAHLVGMFFHEFGHLICDIVKCPNTQKNADRVVKKYFGIEIKYKGPGRVQYVASR